MTRFDTNFINLKGSFPVVINPDDSLFFKIIPITYNDGIRNPRLPRKTSKQTNLQIDSNYIFEFAFNSIENYYSEKEKYKVEIQVFKADDKLGSGDLDNYCKAILDAITFTKKVWLDDKQVDDLSIKRFYNSKSPFSYIELKIIKIIKTYQI